MKFFQILAMQRLDQKLQSIVIVNASFQRNRWILKILQFMAVQQKDKKLHSFGIVNTNV